MSYDDGCVCEPCPVHPVEPPQGGRVLTAFSGQREGMAHAYIDLPPSLVPHYDPLRRRLTLEFRDPGSATMSVLLQITTDGRK